MSSEFIPRMSLYKIKNQLGDDSRYPAISHKKRFVPNVNVLDFVREIFGGIQTLSNTEQILKMEQFLFYYYVRGLGSGAYSVGMIFSGKKTEPHLCILFSIV